MTPVEELYGRAVVPKSDPLPRAKLSLGEFIGHRVWEVHLLDGVQTIRSWVYPCFWIPGHYVSDESHSDGVVFGPIGDYNERGIWAFKSQEALDSEFKKYELSRGLVWGTCYMWGTIIEHDFGYRSQYARIRTLERTSAPTGDFHYGWSLDAPPVNEIDLDFLRKRYMVEE